MYRSFESFLTIQRPWPNNIPDGFFTFHEWYWAFLVLKMPQTNRKRWKTLRKRYEGSWNALANGQERLGTNNGKRSRSRFKNERITVRKSP
jgi:hypothetical protein